MQSLPSQTSRIPQPLRKGLRVCIFTPTVIRSSRVAARTDRNVNISGQSAACSPDINKLAPNLVAALAASFVFASATPGLGLADVAFTSSAVNSGVEARVQREEQLYDDNLQTRELRDFLTLLDKGNSAKLSDLEAGRRKVGRCSEHT